MKNKILVIIDMQHSFSASQHLPTIEACQEEIKKAIKNNEYIFFVEYKGEGATDSRLTDLTKKYSNVYFIQKRADDGSAEIMSKVYSLGIVNSKFRICGVNSDACVKFTVESLAEYGRSGRPCEVVSRACNSDYANNISMMKYFRTLYNVTVV